MEKVTLESARASGRLPEGSFWFIWSGEHQAFWRPGAHGYTQDRTRAGVYSGKAAMRRAGHCGPSKEIVFIRIEADRGDSNIEYLIQATYPPGTDKWADVDRGQAYRTIDRALAVVQEKRDNGANAEFRVVRVVKLHQPIEL